MTALISEVEVVAAQCELGGMAVAVIRGRVAATAFGHRSSCAARRDVDRIMQRLPQATAFDVVDESAVAEDVLDRLIAYAAGDDVDFSDLPLFDCGRTPFQRRVVAACREISRGETRSYGELAVAVGHHGAARAVGTVMSSNPTPLIVPCHRVLAAGGLGGYSARQGVRMKRRLLDMEVSR